MTHTVRLKFDDIDNTTLQRLCGALDENLAALGKALAVQASRRQAQTYFQAATWQNWSSMKRLPAPTSCPFGDEPSPRQPFSIDVYHFAGIGLVVALGLLFKLLLDGAFHFG